MNIDLQQLKIKALKEIGKISDLDSLEKIEKKYLGRKEGQLTLVLRGLKDLPIKKRRRIGPLANEVKREIELGIRNQESGIRIGELKIEKEYFDITLPGIKPEPGHLHPITQFTRKVINVFEKMGFEVVDGPEVETEEYNFDLLNIPPDHPARDVWDTYYVTRGVIPRPVPSDSEGTSDSDRDDEGSRSFQDVAGNRLLLRTHTSPVQLRAMKKRKPPVRIIVPGRVFRREATDTGHETTFYQLEGLVIDKGVRLTDLIGILKVFSQATFGKKTKIRVRPSFFPFTEPSIEVDISCLICHGKGCSLCGTSGWLEVLGAGMVHPNVLRNMKVDPEIWTGYAFGMGIDRLMMLYYGIDDIRLSYGGDLRFLNQF
jgi:phenylalanyl-tRNA synthetase alpha chain